MITPPYLKKGDTIGIIAPARKITYSEIEYAIEVFKQWGLKIKLSENLFKQQHQFSGTDKERTQDFNDMLNNPEVKAIICVRGGYGCIRIIDDLDFNYFIKKPKWIIGYSDITVLHSHIHNKFEIETLHSIMPINFKKNEDSKSSIESLRKALFGEQLSYKINNNKYNIKGSTSGQLIGGNLSILYALSATASDIKTDNKILFIEDIDEYLYHIDRMMYNLKRSGKLNNIKGLIVGGLTDMNDNEIAFGMSAEEIIYNIVKDYDFPVCFGFPAGHEDLNLTLIMGRQIELKVDNIVELIFNYY